MFIDRLISKILEKDSRVVVGLDPRLEQMPKDLVEKYICEYGETFEAVGKIFYEFNKCIIDNVADIVPAVKPQIAFYEAYGIEGLKAYRDTCEYARSKGLLIVGDVKRGDIGSTSKAYSTAFLGRTIIGSSESSAFYSDSITINPYLGDDCMDEFIGDVDKYEKGIFVLVKTSNPSSNQIQDISSEGKTIYERVAEMVNNKSEKRVGKYGYSSIGAVVGATYPEMLKELRDIMPTAYFLVPGYGAQGAGAKDIKDSLDNKGLGALINSSRGIIFAYKKDAYKGLSYGKAARQAAIDMRDDINSVISE